MNYSITLTEEQYSVLESVFSEHNWTFNATCLTDCETKKQTKFSKKAKRKISAECEQDFSSSSDSNVPLAELEQKVRNEGELNENECKFCFLSPCATLGHIPRWVGKGQKPTHNNSGLRKVIYKKFWFQLNGLGAWDKVRYKLKKRQALLAHFGNDYIWIGNAEKRDIIPECVLQFVRNLYPNPPGQSYMDHKWQ